MSIAPFANLVGHTFIAQLETGAGQESKEPPIAPLPQARSPTQLPVIRDSGRPIGFPVLPILAIGVALLKEFCAGRLGNADRYLCKYGFW